MISFLKGIHVNIICSFISSSYCQILKKAERKNKWIRMEGSWGSEGEKTERESKCGDTDENRKRWDKKKMQKGRVSKWNKREKER